MSVEFYRVGLLEAATVCFEVVFKVRSDGLITLKNLSAELKSITIIECV